MDQVSTVPAFGEWSNPSPTEDLMGRCGETG